MADLNEIIGVSLVLRRSTSTKRIMQEFAPIITRSLVKLVVGAIYECVAG